MMNFVGGLRTSLNPVHTIINTRHLTTSLSTLGRHTPDKFYKILRYAKPIKETVYEEGQDLPRGVRIPQERAVYPQYKYETMYFKRQNRGLYGGLQRRVSASRSEYLNKTLRTQLPNIQRKKLWSEALEKSLSLRVSTKVMKTITREGGLDKYLTKDKPARIKTLGLKGWQLRFDVLQAIEQKQLPIVKKGEETIRVTYVHQDGKQFIVQKEELLAQLHSLIQNDSYYPIDWSKYQRENVHLSFGDIVEKLQGFNFDFTQVTAK
ncbi:54S ribosomal protein L24 mitochondrial [Spathaspora sp. JA1]|nr:54S ribosomal protein L24 mitochondrial [Spathaspora sp. JA1]